MMLVWRLWSFPRRPRGELKAAKKSVCDDLNACELGGTFSCVTR